LIRNQLPAVGWLVFNSILAQLALQSTSILIYIYSYWPSSSVWTN